MKATHKGMQPNRSHLEQLQIASPCHASWDAMEGDDKKRFCGECRLHVHDLSAMTAAEAEAFMSQGDGRKCVRFYRRTDGSVLTQDCPRGFRAVRKRVGAAWLVATAALLSVVGCQPEPEPPLMGAMPQKPPVDGPSTTGSPTTGMVAPGATMGKMAAPRPIMGDVAVETMGEAMPIEQGQAPQQGRAAGG